MGGGAIRAFLMSIQLVNSSFVNNTTLSGNNGYSAILLDGCRLLGRVLFARI
jgi:hypothetical protein